MNVHLDATEHADGIVFLHAVKEGPADRSYGLQVAQLAGVPREVIARARQFLVGLENQRDSRRPVSPQGELPLRAPAAPLATPEDAAARALAAAVADLNPDELSPRLRSRPCTGCGACSSPDDHAVGGGVRTRMCSSRSCCSLTSEGASVIWSAAVCVLGNAITSRMLSAPRHQHGETIQAERDTPVRGRTELQRIEQEAEFFTGGRGADAEQLEQPPTAVPGGEYAPNHRRSPSR